MIDRRELFEKARERNLNLQIVEKDYVLGWLLYGLRDAPDLAFKGGTALSKIYFPKVWRMSEDLDFAFTGEDFREFPHNIEAVLCALSKESGIKFRLKSTHENPQYVQMKIGYDAVIGQNWIKIDATKESIMDAAAKRSLSKTYSDYPEFTVNVESIEEIFSEKIRSLIERTKCRDYFDVWKLCQMGFDRKKLKGLFMKKCEIKGIIFESVGQMVGTDTKAILMPYWESELGRLLNPLPEICNVLDELRRGLRFLV